MKACLSVMISILVTFAASSAIAAEHLRLVERATNEKVVSISRAPDAIGDLLVFSNALYDAADRTPVGTSRGSCVRVEVGRWWQCQWTMQLDSGALQVAGSYPDSGDSEFAILGGTGRYAGARGFLKVHARDAAHSAYDFVIELL
jgi:allene oxide cyclase